MFVYVEPETETTVPEGTSVKKEETTKDNITTTSTKEKYSSVKPGKVVIRKAKNIKKRTVSLKWKKISKAKKYQVQYATNKKFKKAKTKITKKTYIKIKKLKKKKYYFRVRAKNNRRYGKWSKVKMVKIKK